MGDFQSRGDSSESFSDSLAGGNPWSKIEKGRFVDLFPNITGIPEQEAVGKRK
jgi:hypothetical protein